MKKYVYVDYENMGNIKTLVPIEGQYFFFIGSNQNSIPKSLVLATKGTKVEWVAVEGSGKNALDFHIAYYLGLNAKENVKHYILSKDKGYDPLIASINKKAKQDIVKRIISMDDLKHKDETEKEESPDFKTLVHKINSVAKVRRPKSESKLKTFITGQIFPQMSDENIMKLIDELYRKKIISKGQNSISYL